MTSEIRCTAPHPKVRGWECRGRLYVAHPGTFDIRPKEDGDLPFGCQLHVCPRCYREYIVCPITHAA